MTYPAGTKVRYTPLHAQEDHVADGKITRHTGYVSGVEVYRVRWEDGMVSEEIVPRESPGEFKVEAIVGENDE